MDFDAAADELYGVPPEDFVARRNALAKQAGDDGDPDLAAQIRRLVKPKLAAWVVNNLVREDRQHITGLLELGESLRAATAALRGDELAALSKQQRQLVSALTKQAVAAAEDTGQRVSTTVTRLVEQTLRAALADPDAADQLQAGRLSDALEYVGFPGGLHVSASTPKARSGRSDRDQPAAHDDKRAALRAARVEARDALAAAKRERDAAQADVTEADRKVELLTNHLDEVRRRVKELSDQLRAAERDQRAAAKDRDRRQADVDAAEKRLAELNDG